MKTLVLMRLLWTVLHRDRLGVALFAIVPVVFLTIFGAAFGGLGGSDISIKIGVLDLDDSKQSALLTKAVEKNSKRIKLVRLDGTDEFVATAPVRAGKFPAAIIIPKGFGKSLLGKGKILPLKLFYDSSNPIAPELARGTLLEAAAEGLGPAFLVRRLDLLKTLAGPLSREQQELESQLEKAAKEGLPGPSPSMSTLESATLPIESVSTTGKRQDRSLVTYYTGAIGMMFLLFSAATVCGSLLEEREIGLTARLFALGIGPTQMILSRFFMAMFIGSIQFTIMLAWAAIIFGVRYFTAPQLIALLLLVPIASAAAAGLGLVVTVPCKTQRQQSTVAVIIVLILSALGGSMIPSFMMPQFLQDAAVFAFNWWAIDAFQQVLWHVQPGDSIGTVLGKIDWALIVLGGAAIVGLAIGRAFFWLRA